MPDRGDPQLTEVRSDDAANAHESAAVSDPLIRVALLDDHEIVRHGVGELVNAQDDMVVVGEAGTASEMLQTVAATAPDIAVLDVRLGDDDGNGIAATNRNLLEMVDDGTFREDLYYRLNVFPIQMPALRERLEDIPTLVRFFLTKLGPRLGRNIDKVPEAILDTLREYSWPGNIRELENIVERAMILTPGETLQLPTGVIPVRKKQKQTGARLQSLHDMERNHIEAVLAHTGGVIAGPAGAAKILELNPNTLRSRMQKLGISTQRSNTG